MSAPAGTPLRLGLYALPFGYGPASKAVAVAEAVQRRLGDVVRWTFVSSGLGLELLRRTGLPARVVDTGSVHDAEQAGVDVRPSLDALIVVMHRPLAARLAPELPVFCVDSLAYMWRPDSFAGFPGIGAVRRYWVQDLFDSVEVMGRTGVPNVRAVPPITDVEPRPGGPDPAAEPGAPTVASLGGLLNPYPGSQHVYLEHVLRLVSDASARPPVVLTSAGAIDRFADLFAGFDARSLSHDAALALFRGAAAVFAPPGLTTILELAQLGRPMLPLPPENYSQVLNLRRLLRHHGADLGPAWRVLDDAYAPIGSDLPEGDGVRAVHDLNERVLAGPAFGAALAEAWRHPGQRDTPLPAALRAPVSGATVIADDLAECLGR
ncbi:hypothetical protein [Micromonospora aurantiaca (nom. illeg.)]|uniref:hypothetical protein n=1 Tax=Micromonospora aurantiaca (nom. illeg.) TaxID=47850 RepID=UPI0033CDEAAA